MAVINAAPLSLLDRIQRMNPDSSIARIVELLTARNPLIEDLVFVQGNLPTGHLITSRTGLPGVTWRRFNEGVAATKSKTNQYVESCGMLAGLSKVDKSLADLSGNAAAFRATEDDAFLMALSNEVETGMFYHSTSTAPNKFQGLAARFNGITSGTAPNSFKQVINMDATSSGGDASSVWLLGHGERTVYGIYPKGTVGGLKMEDQGLHPARDGNNNEYFAYYTNWEWNVGLAVEDPRYVVRVANIDMGNILANGFALIDAMIKGYHKIFKPQAVRLSWYGNRDNGTYLHLQAKNSAINNPVAITTAEGKPVMTFLGVPFKESDAILSTEATLT